MTPEQQQAEARTLIDAAVSGQLTAAEEQRLEELLRTDESALQTYLNACQLEADLYFQIRATLAGRRAISILRLEQDESLERLAAAETETETAAVGVPHARVDWWSRAYRAVASHSRGVAALAAVLCLALFGWWASDYWAEIPAERQPQAIAGLADSYDAEWLGGEVLEPGHHFREGDSIYLTKGRAHISMASGAELVLRAPCFLTLSSGSQVRLEEGAVTAEVAEWGRGFTVVTDALRVVDLGTKFAVSTDAAGIAEAHVLNGRVRVQPMATMVADRRSLLLSGGEAIRIESANRLAMRLAANRDQYDAEMGDQSPFKPIHVFNTGVGLVPGDEDPHWRVTAAPRFDHYTGPMFALVCEADTRYLGNDPGRSQWISLCHPVRPGVPPRSMFTFETTFDLTGYDLSTVAMAAQVIADNGVSAVRLNGQPVAVEPWSLNDPQQTFNRFIVIEFDEGFRPGVNTVEFDVWNGVDRYDAEAFNPVALRVEWQAFGRTSQEAVVGSAVN